MDIGSITGGEVRNALRLARSGDPAESALVAMDAIAVRLRAADITATRETRGWMLVEILEELTTASLNRLLERSAPTQQQDAGAHPIAASVRDGFAVQNTDLEAWTCLYHRYLSEQPLQVKELASIALSGAPHGRRLIGRRLGRGYALLAALLRELELQSTRATSRGPSGAAPSQWAGPSTTGAAEPRVNRGGARSQGLEVFGITEDAVRQALYSIRYAKRLRGNALLDMEAVSARLASEGVSDTADSREWALACVLGDQVRDNLARCRELDPGGTGSGTTLRDERRLLRHDGARSEADLHAWSALYFRYLSGLRLPTAELAHELGISRRTFGRRLEDGHRLLAADLRSTESAFALQVRARSPALQEPSDRRGPAARGFRASRPSGTPGPSAVPVEKGVDEGHRVIELPAARLAEIRGDPDAAIEAFRRARVAMWSQEAYGLDKRFVRLTLRLERGVGTQAGFWRQGEARFRSLDELLKTDGSPALVVVGPPGCGKSTLLRRLDLETAQAGLSGLTNTVGLYVPLSTYGDVSSADVPPPPGQWLSDRWAHMASSAPPLDRLLADGRLLLLLDGLNEMPHRDAGHYRALIASWRRFVQELGALKVGNRAVFSCRSLDYSAPLSIPDLPVPRVAVESLTDAQIRTYLGLVTAGSPHAIWSVLAETPELELLRLPYYLRISVDALVREGHLEGGRAALITGMVRRAMLREIELDNRHFQPGDLVSERDYERLASARRWRNPTELPERGRLIPRLTALAYGMQSARKSGSLTRTRVRYDDAIRLLDDDRAEDILRAAGAMGILEEDRDRDEVLFRHELLQAYFCARRLAMEPSRAAERATRTWRSSDVLPSLSETVTGLARTEALPDLPESGWEEPLMLAAAIATDSGSLLQPLAEANLALAGRIAGQAEVAGRISGGQLARLKWALVRRSRDPEADLRDRIACGLALGDLGDPRLERRRGPGGEYLWPPLVEVAQGAYPIGEDEPISWEAPRTGVTGTETGHMPRHDVMIEAFRIGQYAVTNAEWACFVAAGGYDDDRWWDTDGARRWQRGEMSTDGPKSRYRAWRRRFLADPSLLDRMVDEGVFPNQAVADRWHRWMTLDDAAFELAQETYWRPRRATEPPYWRDSRYNRPAQPVLGVCWYEARAYCRWLAWQSECPVRLPTEVEWEAAARGLHGRAFPWGNDADRMAANSYDTHVRRPTPVGVFPQGDSPEGVADLVGNVWEWTSSLWGGNPGGDPSDHESVPEYPYPYDPSDGREREDQPATVARVSRGGSWNDRLCDLRAAVRNHVLPGDAYDNYGLRILSPVD